MKKSIAMVLAGVMAFSMTACGGGGNTTTAAAGGSGTTAAGSTAAAGGSEAGGSGENSDRALYVEISSDPGDLTPFGNNGTNPVRIKGQIYERLYEYGYNYEVTPILAESWEQKDSTHWVFHLKEGVKFSNGNDFTASDMLFSMNLCKDGTVMSKKYVEFVDFENTKIIDDHTVEVALTSPDAFFFSGFCGVYMVDEESYNASGDGLASEPIGTGPYKFVEWTTGSSVKLTANENWWGGDVKIKDVVFKVITESSQRSIELETGGVDLVLDLGMADYDRLNESSDYSVLVNDTFRTSSIYFNCSEHSACNSKELRQAIAYAIDANGILTGAYSNFGSIAKSFCNEKMLDYNEAWAANDYYTQNLEKAKELLAASGYDAAKPLSIIVSDDPLQNTMAEIIQAYLSQLGVTAEITSYESAVYNNAIDDEAGGWDISFVTLTAPSCQILDICNAFFAEDGINRSCFQNAEFNTLVKKAVVEPDEKVRAEQIDQLVAIVTEEVPAYMMVQTADLYAYNNDLVGFQVWNQTNFQAKDLSFK